MATTTTNWGKQKLSAAAELPVTLEQLKRRAELRVDGTYRDGELLDAARAAVDWIEHHRGRQFVTAVWRYTTNGFRSIVKLPVNPVQSVERVSYLDSAGTRRELDAGDYVLLTDREPAELLPPAGGSWPRHTAYPGSIEIDFTAGYGVREMVPGRAVEAILATAAHWFVHKLPVVVGTSAGEIPLALEAVLDSLSYGEDWSQF